MPLLSTPDVRDVNAPPPAAGHEWTLRWMDGSAVSCGIVLDPGRDLWRVWVVCNRQVSVGGPTFANEADASAWAQQLQDDWALNLSGHSLTPFRQLLPRFTPPAGDQAGTTPPGAAAGF